MFSNISGSNYCLFEVIYLEWDKEYKKNKKAFSSKWMNKFCIGLRWKFLTPKHKRFGLHFKRKTRNIYWDPNMWKTSMHWPLNNPARWTQMRVWTPEMPCHMRMVTQLECGRDTSAYEAAHSREQHGHQTVGPSQWKLKKERMALFICMYPKTSLNIP